MSTHAAPGPEPADDDPSPGELDAERQALEAARRAGWVVVHCRPAAPHRFALERDGRRLLCGDAAAVRVAIGAKPGGGYRR